MVAEPKPVRVMRRDKPVPIAAALRRPTILDVAQCAGVAVGTVSRVINGQPNVRQDKRQRVQAAIVELGYVPDIVAQSMRNNRSMTFACVMRDFTVPVLGMFVDSMQKEIDAFGFSLLVASSYHDIQRELWLLRGFQQRRIDGLVIATSSETDPALVGTLEQMKFPVVLIDRDLPERNDAVSTNHASGMQQAVAYLADLGHRRIALISGEPGVHPTDNRLEGFVRGLRARGLAEDPDLVRLTSFGADAGYTEARRLLERDVRPTAIIAGGSSLLPGVIRATRDLHLSIPGQVSVIAGADSDVAQLTSPPFTVGALEPRQLGRAAPSCPRCCTCPTAARRRRPRR